MGGTIQYRLLKTQEVKILSGNGKLYSIVETFMERAMKNKSG